jgi:hypothetical protein
MEDDKGKELVVFKTNLVDLERVFYCVPCYDAMKEASEKDRIDNLRLCEIYEQKQREQNAKQTNRNNNGNKGKSRQREIENPHENDFSEKRHRNDQN